MFTPLHYLGRITRKILGEEKDAAIGRTCSDDHELVEQARQELETARSLFNNVVEANLIDHAIYRLNAAERRYVFLLEEARQLQAKAHEEFHHEHNEGGNPWGEKEWFHWK